MNKKMLQTYSILLNSSRQFYRYEDLAKALSVSARSVRNYVQGVQEYIRTQDGGGELLTVSDGGVAFTGDFETGQRLYSMMAGGNFYLYCLSPDERVSMTLLSLLLSDAYQNISDFSERFHSSRATTIKDMEQVREILQRYGLSFSPNLNKGYLLAAAELPRRQMIKRIVTTAGNSLLGRSLSSNLYYRFLMETCGGSEKLLADVILETESQFDMNVSDACFEEMLLDLSVLVARLASGHVVSGAETLPEPAPDICRSIAAYMLEQIRLRKLIPDLPETVDGEVRALAVHIQSGRFYPTEQDCTERDMQLHMALTYFLVAVSKELSIPFYNDRAMAELLESHLQSMITLRTRGMQIQNEYKDQIIREYPDYYRVVKAYKSVLEDCSGYEYQDGDIVFVIMYLLVSAEKFFTEDMIPRIIVCCHTGMGTANFLAEQLKNNYHVRLMAVTSNHKLAEFLRTHECDLIVSTTPLSEVSRPWVQVSPLLTDQNIIELTNRFTAIRRERGNYRIRQTTAAARCVEDGRTLPGSISGMGAGNILLDYTCAGPEEAIRLAALPLVENESILPGYIDAIIDFYHKNGAYFVYCPHVALAHAGPLDGVRGFGCSILRVEPGIVFGKEEFDPVRYVICIAVPDRQSYTREILTIMNLFSLPENLECMDRLHTATEFCEFIKNKTGGTL